MTEHDPALTGVSQYAKRYISGVAEDERLTDKVKSITRQQKEASTQILQQLEGLGLEAGNALSLDVDGKAMYLKRYTSTTYRVARLEMLVDAWLITRDTLTSEKKLERQRGGSGKMQVADHCKEIANLLKGDLATRTARFKVEESPPSGDCRPAGPDVCRLTTVYLAATVSKKVETGKRNDVRQRTKDFAERSAEQIASVLGERTGAFADTQGNRYTITVPKPRNKAATKTKVSASIPALTKNENELLIRALQRVNGALKPLNKTYVDGIPPSVLRQTVEATFEKVLLEDKAKSSKRSKGAADTPPIPRVVAVKRTRTT